MIRKGIEGWKMRKAPLPEPSTPDRGCPATSRDGDNRTGTPDRRPLSRADESLGGPYK